MLWIGSDLQSFGLGGQVASEANFGLWPLLMGLVRFFYQGVKTIQKYAIPIHFGPLGGALASYHYFGLMEGIRFFIITIPSPFDCKFKM